MFLVLASMWVFFGPVTMDRADKLDGVRDYNFTTENYVKALEPIVYEYNVNE